MSETSQKQREEDKKIVLNAKELIEALVGLLECKGYKKKLPYPKFNIQEARFIRDLIFRKPRGLVFFYLADYIMNDSWLRHLTMLNAPSMKKLRFFFTMLDLKSSAKAAAIKAGYSPRTAKQQGHRILREIQGYKRMS